MSVIVRREWRTAGNLQAAETVCAKTQGRNEMFEVRGKVNGVRLEQTRENGKMIGQLAKAERHEVSCWRASEVVKHWFWVGFRPIWE